MDDVEYITIMDTMDFDGHTSHTTTELNQSHYLMALVKYWTQCHHNTQQCGIGKRLLFNFIGSEEFAGAGPICGVKLRIRLGYGWKCVADLE